MKVTVKDIIEYLEKMDPEMDVILDDREWVESDDVSVSIGKSGVFWVTREYMVINN